jgi:methionyl aminopeptidase
MFTRVKTTEEISAMRESGQMLATVLEMLKRSTQSGMSTKYLAGLASKELKTLGGEPAFLGYQGFPDVLCVSINEEIVHGIPKKQKVIQQGDIVSLDFGVYYRGMITDGALSFLAGGAGSSEDEQLIRSTEESMFAGIDVLHNGIRTGDIGSAVEAVLNKKHYGVIRNLVGHGVGHHLHEGPDVPNYGTPGSGSLLVSGMTIAIEPMATLGGYDNYTASDGWTVITKDGSRSAHFENTVLITENGYEIMTVLRD